MAWWDEAGQRAYEFITNAFERDATIIAQLYRYRWQIELFFKKLKQDFPHQYFVGYNQSAIEIQIWCSLIALLLTSVLHSQHTTKMAFSVFITVLRLHFFNYIALPELLRFYEQKRYKRRKKSAVPDLFSSP
jgi:IS4 transposase